MSYKLLGKLTNIILVLTVSIVDSGSAYGMLSYNRDRSLENAFDMDGKANSHLTITFEEPIQAPGNVQTQYCADPGTNKGVKFQSGFEISEPAVATSSPTHALTELVNVELDPHFGPLTISFTTGQSHVGAMVGLDKDHGFPVTAVLRAYDDPDPGEGTKLTPDPDPTVALGNGPTAITTPLAFSTPTGESLIRRVEIEFVYSEPFGLKEVIDDLTFSEIGPPCVTDAVPPTVEIFEPATNQSLNDPQALVHFRAQDVGSGIATIKVSMLGPGNTELGSYFFCGGGGFSQNCPGFPLSLDIEKQYKTFLPAETTGIRVGAMDFAGNIGQDEVTFNLTLPDPTFNLWALGVEVTQGIQSVVPSSTASRGAFAPVQGLFTGTPLVANKRTVVRVYPGVEDTTSPVVGARAKLYCIKTLEANPLQSEPCDGPPTADLFNPEVTVDPANDNDLTTLRLNPSLTWNFILPAEWTEPGGRRWLVALVQAPINLPECGSFLSGCHDGANLFVLEMPDFHETAPLIIQPIFACVRRLASQAREDCMSDLVSGTLVATVENAIAVSQSFLWGEDWDQDGLLDPVFSVIYPVADRSNGAEIWWPIINDFVDGIFSDTDADPGIMSRNRMEAYWHQVCGRFVLDFAHTVAPPNLRYLGFVPPPTGPGGLVINNDPCAVTKTDLSPGRVGDNDFDPTNGRRFTVHFDEFTIAHEIGHTYGIQHASCDHDEDLEGACDPAPSVFPCPHGGICLSLAQKDEPFAFNTFNMAVLPPRNEILPYHTHDFMSYGFNSPTWISRHTYDKLFNALQSSLTSSALLPVTSARESKKQESSSLQMAMFVSGQIEQPGKQETINSLYQIPVIAIQKNGRGSYILELQRANGQVLSRRRFDPIRIADGAPEVSAHFFELLPLSPKAARLVLKEGNSVLFERNRTPNTPVVKLLSPAAGDVWATGPQTISWEASDLDGDSLVFTVQYSKDMGETWTTLALNWIETSWQADAALLAGSEPGHALIRVLASDGFNSVIAESAPFTVHDKVPHVQITLPANGTVFEERELVNFIGAALDIEDGTLEDAAYTWSSNRDGSLGQGHELRLTTLSVGQHVVTLTVQDDADNISQSSITIEILGQPNTQPIAEAGPDQIVSVGASVQLNGEASYDPDGDPLSFSWRFVSIPDGLTSAPVINDPDTATPSILTPVVGEYVWNWWCAMER